MSSSGGRSILTILLPNPPRSVRGYRAISIGLRSVHIFGFGLLLGLALEDPGRTPAWAHALAGASGVALLLLECCCSAAYVVQGAGLLLVIKLVLLVFAYRVPDATLWFLAGIVLLGSVASHMPRRMRHWSPIRACSVKA